MQHERLFALAGQTIDDLRIAARAQRRHHQRLGLAAGEQGRAVRAGQDARANADATHRLGVAAVDARMTAENTLAYQTVFQIAEFGADLLGRELGRSALRPVAVRAATAAALTSLILA